MDTGGRVKQEHLPRATYMGKDLTEVRSPQRPLIPDAEDWERYELPFLRGIAYKAKTQPKYRFRDLSREVYETLLRNSFRKLNKKAASGVDRVTYFDYKENFEEDDKRFLRLIRKWLKAGILEEDQSIHYPEEGTSQGGSISPDPGEYLPASCHRRMV